MSRSSIIPNQLIVKVPQLRLIGLILGVLIVVATRWAYRSHYLFHWDSVQFALALQHFDLTKHQPHPPGYIFYVGLGKLFSFFIHDANLAFVLIGIVASVIGFLLIYQLGKEIFNELTGWVAGILFITNSLIWFQGLVAEVYIVEAAATLLVLLLANRYLRKPENQTLALLLLSLGILGGFRQTTELFLLPLVAYVFFSVPGWQKRILWAFALGVGANLLWFVPNALLSGGFAKYLFVNTRLTTDVFIVSNGLIGAIQRFMGIWTIVSRMMWPEAIVGVITGLIIGYRVIDSQASVNRHQVWFWVLSIVPGLAFLVAVWFTNLGYLIFAIPALLVLVSAGIVTVGQMLQRRSQLANHVLVGTLIVVLAGFQVWQFYTIPPYFYGAIGASRLAVDWADTSMDQSTKMIRDLFTPQNAIIISSNTRMFFSFRHYQWYTPEFNVYTYTPSPFPKNHPIWHAHGPNISEFVDAIPVPVNVRYVVRTPGRDAINSSGNEYEKKLLREADDGPNDWVYYDLKDPGTLGWLKQYPNLKFNFIGR
jgi:hypothetical protein